VKIEEINEKSPLISNVEEPKADHDDEEPKIEDVI